MSNDTAAALNALIQQVTKLTDTVSAQQMRLDGLHDQNTRILDQKKDLQRKLESSAPSPELIKKMANAGLEPGPDGKDWFPIGTRPTHSLTRNEARDTAKYRAAKEAAAKAGAELKIIDLDAEEDQHRRQTYTPTDTSLNTHLVKDEDRKVAYLRRDQMDDVRQYQGLRNLGFMVQSWDTADDLPQHMQTKLRLMEKANAQEANG